MFSLLADKLCSCCCLRRTLNEMRAEINTLQQENQKLKTEVDRFQEIQVKLKETEQKLEDVAILQGRNVDVLVEQVREFQIIQEKVQETLEAKVIQNLISVVLTADYDGDFIIDPEEISGLESRLKCIDGVDFSADNFHMALSKSGYDPDNVDVKKGGFSIKAVLDVIKNLVDDDVPDEENIFHLHPEQVLLAAGKCQ